MCRRSRKHFVVHFADPRAVDQHPARRSSCRRCVRPRRRSAVTSPFSAGDHLDRRRQPAGRRTSRRARAGRAGGTRRGSARDTSAAPATARASVPLRSRGPTRARACCASVTTVDAAAGKVVHHPADRLFVAGDGARGNARPIALLQLDVPVIVDGDARQRRVGLALRAGDEADDVLRREGSARRCP